MSDTAVIDDPETAAAHDAVRAKLGLDADNGSVVEDDAPENAVIDETPAAQEAEPEAEVDAEAEPVAETEKVETPTGEEAPTNDAWAKQRIKFKEMETELAELKKADVPVDAVATEPIAAPTTKQPTATDVMLALVQAKNGELAEGVDSVQVTRLAEQAIANELSSQELTAVLSEARQGLLGENSERIAMEAQQAVLIAQARESRDSATEQAETQRTQQESTEATATRQAELNAIEKHMPEFVNPESPEFKAIPEWIERNIGKIDTHGKITYSGIMSADVANYMLAHQLEICKQVAQEVSRSTVKETQQNARVAAERKAVALSDSPASATPGVQPNQSGKTPHEAAKEKLFEMGRSIGAMKSERLV